MRMAGQLDKVECMIGGQRKKDENRPKELSKVTDGFLRAVNRDLAGPRVAPGVKFITTASPGLCKSIVRIVVSDTLSSCQASQGGNSSRVTTSVMLYETHLYGKHRDGLTPDEKWCTSPFLR